MEIFFIKAYNLNEQREKGDLMDKNTEKIIWIILYVSFIFIFIFLILFSPENRAILGILSSLLIISSSLRLSIIYLNDKNKSLGKCLIYMDLAVIYWLLLIDKSNVSILYILIILIDSILFHDKRFSIFIIILSYISYMLSKVPNLLLIFDYRQSAFLALVGAGIFAFISSILYFTKHQILQKQKILNIMEQLEHKNMQLQKAYEKLKEHSEALEEMAALKERNRIAREIHDTVGHTLTTVLVEMEAGKRLLCKDKKDLALEKIDLAQEQVRKGLVDIRKSVRLLKEGEDILDFIPAIKLLIEDTMKHTGIKVDYNINIDNDIPKNIQKIIYNGLMEGLTNGIKHGNSSKFMFRLYVENQHVFFYLKDNGVGFENIDLGFGLSAMKEQVESVKGYFNMSSIINEGTTLSIEIPLM